MILPLAVLLLASPAQPSSPGTAPWLGRSAELALACVHKEYPNKITHVLNGDADVKARRELTPAFYGCYDWHSSVHGHWLLVPVASTPRASSAQRRSGQLLPAASASVRAEAIIKKRRPSAVTSYCGRGDPVGDT
jgi:hypothetical protein